MLVKTFEANDMPEALRMVKAEFGSDAMILSSGQKRRKGLLGRFYRPRFEITAGLETGPREAPPAPPRQAPPEETTTFDAFQRSMLAPLARELKELRAKVETLSARSAEEGRERRESEAAPPGDGALRAEVEGFGRVLFRRETAERAAPGAARVRQWQAAEEEGLPHGLAGVAEELRAAGVGEDETRALLLPLAESADRGDGAALRQRLRMAISSRIQCAGPVPVARGRRVMALVGPTGVGKTTTIAKLAARAVRKGLRVGLITVDTFRVGAVDQLKTYSAIMGIPLEVASTRHELEEALANHGDKQLVFIDTAGRSPRDRESIVEMKSLLAAGPEIEVHLCLSATTRDHELDRIVGRFGLLPLSRLLFTKLDESDTFGCIVNMHLRHRLPLSYFTVGQRVPEDLEPATAERVAALVIKERNS